MSSVAEKMVANYLKENGYTLTYEPSVPVVDNRELDRIWHPDFLINELGLYVEVCGADRPNDYPNRREVYKKNNIDILFVETFKDEYKWKYYLDSGIQKFKNDKLTQKLRKMKWRVGFIFSIMTVILISIAIFYSTEIWFGRWFIPVYGIVSVLFLFFYIRYWDRLEQEIQS